MAAGSKRKEAEELIDTWVANAKITHDGMVYPLSYLASILAGVAATHPDVMELLTFHFGKDNDDFKNNS